MNFWSVIGALIPALVVVGFTQHYLWKRANRDLYVVKYENTIKSINYEVLVTGEYFYKVCAELHPEAPENLDLFKDFERAMQELNQKHVELNLITDYDDSLLDIAVKYSDTRTDYVLKMLSVMSGAKDSNSTAELGKLHSDYRALSSTYLMDLKKRINVCMSNPISNPLYKFWLKLKTLLSNIIIWK